MFTSILNCPNCSYESPSYCHGYNIHEQTYLTLFVSRHNRSYALREVPMEELERRGVKFEENEDAEVVGKVFQSFAADGEQHVGLPWHGNATLEIRCPECGHIGMERLMDGGIT